MAYRKNQDINEYLITSLLSKQKYFHQSNLVTIFMTYLYLIFLFTNWSAFYIICCFTWVSICIVFKLITIFFNATPFWSFIQYLFGYGSVVVDESERGPVFEPCYISCLFKTLISPVTFFIRYFDITEVGKYHYQVFLN